MTQDTTNNYKITTCLYLDVFAYIDADEEIPDYTCYESLQEFKESMLTQLEVIKCRVNKLTMKEIKKGVRL